MRSVFPFSIFSLQLGKKLLVASCLISLVFLGFPQASSAATGSPYIIHHQGRLLDSSGSLLGGASGTDYCFQFSLYDAVSGGTKLWPSGTPSTMTVEVVNGIFGVGIGDVPAGGDVLDYNFQENDTVYLNVRVAEQVAGSCVGATFETLAPRHRIFSSPYALNANTVGGFVPSQTATGEEIPVLSGGNLTLSGTDPEVSASGTNALVLQGSSTGDINFFSALNTLTSSGALTIAGSLTANGLTISSGTISLPAGSVENADLQNSSLSVVAGSGLVDGGAVSLGGSTSLNIGAGTGIAVAADSVSVSLLGTSDGTGASSSNSGLEFQGVGNDALALLQGCADGQVLKWSDGTGVWQCANDTSGGGGGSLQDAYDNGATITLGADDVLLELANDTSDAALVLDNTSSGDVAVALTISTSGTGATIATALDLSDADIGTALALGNNDVTVGGVTLSASELALLDSGITLAEITDSGTLTITTVDINGGAIDGTTIGATSPSTGAFTTLSSTGATTLGNNSSTVAINSSSWDISTTGTVTGVTISTASNTITGIGSANITDGSIALADLGANSVDSGIIVDGSIANTDLANSSITVTAGTGLSGGGAVSLGGSVSLASTLGTAIDSSEITDDTITASDLNPILTFADGDLVTFASINLSSSTEGLILPQAIDVSLATAEGQIAWDSDDNVLYVGTSSGVVAISNPFGASIDSSEITDETIVSADIDDGSIANADLTNSSLTVTAGTGLSGGGAVSLGGSVSLASTLGVAIDSSEITDGTIANADLADGSVDSDTILNAAIALADLAANSVDSSKIVDGSIALADLGANSVDSGIIVDGSIANADLANSSVTVTAGTGLSGGGAVSLGGSVSLSSTLGVAIDSSEITDGTITGTDIASATIALANLAGDSVNSSKIVDGSVANTDLVNSSLTVTAGTGLSGGGLVSLGGTVSLTSVLGTAIDSSEITDDTITASDLNPILTFADGDLVTFALVNLSSSTEGLILPQATDVSLATAEGQIAWDSDDNILYVGTSSGVVAVSNPFGSSIDSSEITDGTVSNTDLANSSVTVTAGTGLSGGGAVSLGGSVSIASTLGVAIDSSEITDGTIANADLADGSVDSDTILNAAIALADLAANSVDSSKIVDGSIALADLAADSIDSGVILDGSIANADLANSSITVTAGTGLSGGGLVSLGGSVSLASTLGTAIDSSEITDGTIVSGDIADGTITGSDILNDTVVLGTDTAGNYIATLTAGGGLTGSASSEGATPTVAVVSANGAIVVNADDLTFTIATSGDALSATTSSGSGLEVLSSGLAMIQGCTDGQVLKWDETSDVWACASDTVGGGSGTLQDAYDNGATITLGADDVLLELANDTTDAALVLDNTSSGDVAVALTISTSGTGATIATALDLSDADIGTALALGNNDVTVGGATLSASELALLDSGISYAELTDSGTLTVSTVDINGGAIDGAAIGATSASTGAFTTLSSSGTTSLGDGSQTVAIDSNDWDISTSGVITGISFDANGSGNSITNIEGADILDDSIVLGTDTAGNYVATLTAGGGLTGSASSEGATPTVAVVSANGAIVVNADDLTFTVATSGDALSATTSSGSGLEVLSSGLAMIQGCTDGQVLKWNETTDVWECSTDTVGGTGGNLQDAYDNGATITLGADDVLLELANDTSDAALVLDNTSSGDVAVALTISTSGTGATIATALDLSDADIGTALALGNNDVTVGGVTLSASELALLDSGITLAEITDSGTLTITTVDINGGAIDGTTIGATTPSTGAFTTLSSTGATTLGNNSSTVAINSSDWDIDATGGITGVSFDANGSGNSITNIEGADIVNDSIALGTDTAGNYLAGLTAGGGLTGSASSEGATPTVAVVSGNGAIVVNTDDITFTVASSADALSATVSSGSGLEVLSSGLAMIQGCTDGQVLKWNETSDVWACSNDILGGGGTTLQDAYDNGATLTLAGDDLLLELADDGADPALVLDNTSTGDVAIALTVSTSGVGATIATALDLSDADIGTALALGSNDVTVGGATLSASEMALLDSGITFAEITDSGTLTITTVDINGGAIDGTTIGATTPSTGAFTTLTTTGVVTIGNNSATVAINSNDWDISTSGAITGVFFDANGSGNSITNIEGADILDDSIVLGTDTAGNYVATLTAGGGLTGSASSEGATPTVAVVSANGAIVVNADDIGLTLATSSDALSATTSSGSGLEVLSSGLAMIQGCTDGQVLKWNETSDVWACGADATGGGGGNLQDAYDNGATITLAGDDLLLQLADDVADAAFVLDNSSTGAVDAAFLVTTTGSGATIATALDLSDADIATALALGSNDVTVGGATLSASEIALLDSGISYTELTDSGTLTATTVDINGGAIDGTTIGATTPSTGAFTTFATTGITTIGNGSQTVAIDSNDWDISTTGAITGVSFDANGSGNSITNIEGADILDDSVVLGTDTAGNYVATLTAGGGLTGSASSEGATPTVAVVSANGAIVVNADDIGLTLVSAADGLSANTSSGSGMEIVSSGLALLQGCSNGQILKWTETSDTWGCASDATGGGGGGSDLDGAYDADTDGILDVDNSTTGLHFRNIAGAQFVVDMASATAPTVDMMQIANNGGSQGTTTTGVDGLQIDFVQGTDGGADTNAGLLVNVTSGNEAGNILRALAIGDITGGASSTETGIYVGTGFDYDIQLGDATPNILLADGAGLTIQDASGATGNTLLNVGSTTNRGGLSVYGDITKRGSIAYTDLTNISDTFLYETSKDSDAGAWINSRSSQALPWYTETKDDGAGDPCNISSDDRCGSSAFPSRALLVSTASGVYIFDADTNNLWMKFTQDGTYALGADANNNPSAIFGLNGTVYVSMNGTSGTGLYAFDFVHNRMYRYDATNRVESDVAIESRNSTVTYATGAVTKFALANSIVNDVHAAVLAGSDAVLTNGAPLNGGTFVAVATDSGISVINLSSGVTLDYTQTAGDDFNAVFLTKRGELYGLNETQAEVDRWGSTTTPGPHVAIDTTDISSPTRRFDEVASTSPELFATAVTFATNAPDALDVVERVSATDDVLGSTGVGDVIYVAHSGGVSEIHDKNPGTSFATPAIIAKYYTTTYETGLLVGRRAIALPFHETSGSDFASVASSASGSLSFEAFNNPQRVDGVHGTGLSLNGTSQYLCLDFSANDGTCDATNTPGYGAISFTLSGWFKHSTSISGTDVLMDRRYAAIGGAEGKGWTVEMNSSGNLVFGIQDTAATAAYDDSVTSTQTFNDGLWHHFAAVNTDTALCLYVDGRLTVACDTTLAATLTLDATQYTTIGADLSAVGGANFWDGAIDDIQIAASTAATTQNSVPAHVVRKMYLEGRSALNKGTTIVENATEFSSTTIGDSGETWAPNKFAGQIVEITGGTGAGQTRTIVSNTATTMTVTPAWTVTPDTTSDFESNPETLYGGTSNAVSIQATIPDFQSEYRVYVGTSDGSDGGGITVLSGYGTAHQSDVYHADSAKVDSSGLSWSGTDMDDIKAFAIGDSLQVFATQKGLWSEVGEVDLQQVRDQVTKSLQYIRFELYGDGASATSLEAGTMGGADLAEYYYANEPLEPGDVVAIEPTQPAGITRSMIPYSETMLGVVSTDPGIILGPQAENAYPIALAGRVPVKITDENGPIHVGDYLTSSSRPGYAMRATKAGAVIGKVLNEPETLVACGAELPEMSEAVSEGPGVEVEGGQGAEEIISDAPSTLEEEVSLSGEPQCGYAVVFIALGESRGTNVQTLAEAFTATETVADVTIEFDGLSSATDEERSLETQQMILSFLRALPERVEGVLPQSIFTDRLAAGLDVITPTLLADTITTNILRAGDASSLVVALGEEGRFTLTSPLVQEGDTEVQETPIFEIDAEGNALFAGAIRAKDFLLTSPSADLFQEQTAILSDAVSGVTTGMGEFALSLSDLSARVAVLTEEGDALRTKDEELTETLATVSTDRATQLVFNTSVTEGLDLLAARLDVLELQSQNFSESLATLLSEWQLAEEAVSETSSLTLAGDLNVAGSAFFTNGIQLDLLGTEGGSLRILSDLWFIGRPYVNSDTAGFARIHEGDTFVRVEFEDAYLETPTVHVDLSFRAPETEGMSDEEAFAAREAVRQVEQQYLADTVRFLVTEKDERGFTIQLNHEAEYDLEFDWFALAVDRPRLSESSHAPIEVSEPPETQEESAGDASSNVDTEIPSEELEGEPQEETGASQEEESSSSSDTEGGDVSSDSPESSQESVPPSEETSDASSESSSDTSSEPSTPSSSESSSESSSGSESAPSASAPSSSEGGGDGGGGEGA